MHVLCFRVVYKSTEAQRRGGGKCADGCVRPHDNITTLVRECVRSGPLSPSATKPTALPPPPLPPNGFSYVENDRQVVRRAVVRFSTPRTAGHRAGDMCASRRSSAARPWNLLQSPDGDFPDFVRFSHLVPAVGDFLQSDRSGKANFTIIIILLNIGHIIIFINYYKRLSKIRIWLFPLEVFLRRLIRKFENYTSGIHFYSSRDSSYWDSGCK